MIQINNGFKDFYYLKEDGTIYNDKTKRTLKPYGKSYVFTLTTTDNKRKKIVLKTLYKALYNANYCEDTIEDLDNEQWKEIEGTEKEYQVSNKGRIKSLKGYKAVILKPFKTQSGYLRVDITIEGERQTKLVHRLVGAAFLDNPKNIDMQIHHKDGNKTNNAADNLCWLTMAQHKKAHSAEKKEVIKDKQQSEPKTYYAT